MHLAPIIMLAAIAAGQPTPDRELATADARAEILAQELDRKAGEESKARSSEPVSVTILGPRDAELGDQSLFKLDTTGTIEFYFWDVTGFVVDANGRPRMETAVSGLVPMGTGDSAVFSNRQPGRYLISVSVSGPRGLDAIAWEFEILEPAQQPAQQPAQPQPQQPAQLPMIQQAPVQQPAQQAQQPDPNAPPRPEQVDRLPDPSPQEAEAARRQRFEQQAIGWINRAGINSPAQCQAVAGSFRSFASRAQRGQLAAGTAYFPEAYAQARLALGGEIVRWNSFFSDFNRALGGVPEGARNNARIYLELADILDRVRF